MNYFVFDVESIDLYGEGFAIGYVIVDQDGNELASNYLACSSENAIGLEEAREWIEAFVLPFLPAPTIENYTLATPHSIREVF